MGICDSKNEAKKTKLNPTNEVMIGGKPPTILDPSIAYVSKSFCKIALPNGIASGFLIKLYKGDQDIFFLMTCEHVITREMIRQREKLWQRK